jgi:hypothetical protein
MKDAPSTTTPIDQESLSTTNDTPDSPATEEDTAKLTATMVEEEEAMAKETQREHDQRMQKEVNRNTWGACMLCYHSSINKRFDPSRLKYNSTAQ